MAVVKLTDGSLWVHSPVELDAPLRQALEELGPVGHIVSPNYEHVKWVIRIRVYIPFLSKPQKLKHKSSKDKRRHEPLIGNRAVFISTSSPSGPHWSIF